VAGVVLVVVFGGSVEGATNFGMGDISVLYIVLVGSVVFFGGWFTLVLILDLRLKSLSKKDRNLPFLDLWGTSLELKNENLMQNEGMQRYSCTFLTSMNTC
jgi:hypothetical protein